MKSNKYSAVSAFLGRGKAVPVKTRGGKPADTGTQAGASQDSPAKGAQQKAAPPKRNKPA